MAMRVSTVAEFFSGEEKLTKKGEYALQSGRLHSFVYEGNAGGMPEE